MMLVYGFDWSAYTGLVMPAFARWLVEGEESGVYQLYQHTRCAREEQYIPPMLCPVRTWTRALEFVARLPRGAHIREEYQMLCDAEQFTAVSDRYTYRHTPQFYPQAEVLRVIWGAIVAEYCQSSFSLPQDEEAKKARARTVLRNVDSALDFAQKYLLACNNVQRVTILEEDALDLWNDGEDVSDEESAQGVKLGRHPASLHLRGWLASRSIRAMAFFELLACGRRAMPLGCRTGAPYEDYIGYLTPGEVRKLADCLRSIQPPVAPGVSAVAGSNDAHLVDEVVPARADALLSVVRMAAQYELGLLCRVD